MIRLIFFGTVLLLTALMLSGCVINTSDPNPEPIADFTMSGQTVTPANITFTNYSTDADSYHWDFDDGRTSTLASPVVSFDEYGSYLVILTATNSSTGDYDTESKTLVITPGEVYLEAVVVEEVPYHMPDGSEWDLNGTWLDLQWDFLNPSDANIFSTQTLVDVSPDAFPVRWVLDSPYRMSDWTGNYSFKFWDDDNPFGYEAMGTVFCRINSLINIDGYADSYTLGDVDGRIQIRIEVTWE